MRRTKKVIEKFRDKGLRVTPQRRLIFELLAVADSHHTVEDLYQKIRQKMPDVSLATVYNTVHELVEMGELKEVKCPGSDSTRYDTNTTQHHHIYCEKCHQIVDVEGDLMDIHFPKELFSGYKINRSQVTFYGICPKCRK
ncbi:MAG: Fur family transcriptional regulator [Brevefilum sp.]